MKNRDELNESELVSTIWNDLEVASKEVVMEAARQFAQAFTETDQYKEFEQSYENFRQDAEAQNALGDLQKKRASLQGLLMLNALGEEEQQELQALENRVRQQPSFQRYTKAQEALITMSQQIGDVISESIGLEYSTSCKTGSGSCCG